MLWPWADDRRGHPRRPGRANADPRPEAGKAEAGRPQAQVPRRHFERRQSRRAGRLLCQAVLSILEAGIEGRLE